MTKRYRDVIGIIAFFTVIRLAVAATFGLGVDEAHYILYAINLDWSYVDHPPLVGWFHAPFYTLFGTSEFLVRLPAILLFAIASFLAYLFTMQISGSRKIALLAVVALNSSFLLNAMSLMLLPDSFLLVLIIPLIFTILRIEETGELKYYIALGLILGLCGLAKYTSVVLVPSIFVYFVFRKRFDLIFSAWTIVSMIIALLLDSGPFCTGTCRTILPVFGISGPTSWAHRHVKSERTTTQAAQKFRTLPDRSSTLPGTLRWRRCSRASFPSWRQACNDSRPQRGHPLPLPAGM